MLTFSVFSLPSAASAASCAFDNQQEYDQAAWKLSRPRYARVRVSVPTFGDDPLTVSSLRAETKSATSGRSIALNADQEATRTLRYNSFLRFVFTSAQPALSALGVDRWEFLWKRPGQWFSKLDFRLDALTFSILSPSDSEISPTGDATYDFLYDPSYTPREFSVGFGSLLGVTPKLDGDMQYKVAHGEIVVPGHARLVIHWKTFFSEWNQSYSKPYVAGDTFPLSLFLSFTPPADAVTEVVSKTKKDRPFVAKKYACTVDSSEGNPFLDIPDTQDETMVRMSSDFDVPLTKTMF